ncbi:transposase [Clostridium sp. Marseille-Q7071]
MTTKFTRKFTEEERVGIVKEPLEYGNNALVAVKYDINPKLLSTWKGNYRRYQQTLKPKEPKEENIIVNYKKEYKKLVEENKQKNLEIAVLRELLKKRK